MRRSHIFGLFLLLMMSLPIAFADGEQVRELPLPELEAELAKAKAKLTELRTLQTRLRASRRAFASYCKRLEAQLLAEQRQQLARLQDAANVAEQLANNAGRSTSVAVVTDRNGNPILLGAAQHYNRGEAAAGALLGRQVVNNAQRQYDAWQREVGRDFGKLQQRWEEYRVAGAQLANDVSGLDKWVTLAEQRVRREKRLGDSWKLLVPPAEGKDALFTSLSDVSVNPFEGLSGNFPPFKIDGTWKFEGESLQPEGTMTAVAFETPKDFVFQSDIDLGTTGGMFFLIGWENGTGYCLRGLGLRKTSELGVLEFREGKPVPFSYQALSTTRTLGQQRCEISVKGGKLTMNIGATGIADELLLKNYKRGSLVIGTFPFGYGPRPLKIRSARVRAD